MRQGFVTAVMDQYSFEEVVDFASENGFECIEVSCWPREKAERRYAGVTHIDVDELDNEYITHILKYCKKKKVEISALAYYPNVLEPDLEKRTQYIEHLKKVIVAAKKLNVNMVTTFIGRVPQLNVPENLKLAEKVWNPLLNFAENLGVRIAIENCPMLFTEDEWPGGKNIAISPAIWRQLFEKLKSPNLGLNYDPSHFIWQEIDYIKPVYEFKDKIFHVHYKDIKLNKNARSEVGVLATPLSYMTPRIPGHGDVDWGEYIAALLEVGYDGPACIEIEDKSFENSKEGIENALKISREYLKQFVAYPEKGV
ncbi:sugar phosphate isomerase/epimerase [Mediterraneibacter sp. NSJ-55]|uniref:Sugar phosphate isomerase/epimerase n=1 Tax=Mediterraneibacter hominis TaxID=2763054 RepID=A0A923RQ63_9FIRM|nr:sugar phosphate isomerase/epimerase [Mediterraneibacter hominis]MBC5688338.1 sugar phosphate isomerase/epimerase [Mediterraneibacter hominis]